MNAPTITLAQALDRLRITAEGDPRANPFLDDGIVETINSTALMLEALSVAFGLSSREAIAAFAASRAGHAAIGNMLEMLASTLDVAHKRLLAVDRGEEEL